MTAHDNWPRTYRLLPWLLAAFVCMIWLVPTEGVELSVPLPVDPTPDRFLLGAIVLLWLASLWARRALVPSTAAQAFSWTLLIFVTVALVSVALNAETLAGVGELEQATKKLVVLVGYALLFFVVATVVRPGELKNFGIFMVGLAAIVAVGAIYEYRVDYNVFYDLAKKLFSGIASVAPTPNEDGYGRRDTFGATHARPRPHDDAGHGLALRRPRTERCRDARAQGHVRRRSHLDPRGRAGDPPQDVDHRPGRRADRAARVPAA